MLETNSGEYPHRDNIRTGKGSLITDFRLSYNNKDENVLRYAVRGEKIEKEIERKRKRESVSVRERNSIRNPNYGILLGVHTSRKNITKKKYTSSIT